MRVTWRERGASRFATRSRTRSATQPSRSATESAPTQSFIKCRGKSVQPVDQALLQHQPRPRPQPLGLALELPAGGEDVAAARGANGAGVAGVEDNFGKPLDGLPIRTFVRRAGPGVERNEVDLRRQTFQQFYQRARFGRRI